MKIKPSQTIEFGCAEFWTNPDVDVGCVKVWVFINCGQFLMIVTVFLGV